MEREAKVELVRGSVSCSHFAKNLAEMIQVEAEQEKMLKWSEADLREKIESGDSIFALADGEIVGFVCLIIYPKNVEIVALIVSLEYRQRGISLLLIKQIINLVQEKYPDKSMIMFANTISSCIGKRFGFITVDKETLDDVFWEVCDDCSECSSFPNCHCQPMMLMQ